MTWDLSKYEFNVSEVYSVCARIVQVSDAHRSAGESGPFRVFYFSCVWILHGMALLKDEIMQV